MPCARCTAYSPGSPVWRMPAAVIDWRVWVSPAEPKSCEWLLALLRTVKPTSANAWANDGGLRNAKQLEDDEPHLLLVWVVNVPSRLAKTTSTLRTIAR